MFLQLRPQLQAPRNIVEKWPPNSPDLNPLDFAIWSMVQQGACQEHPESVATLKRRVSVIWIRRKSAPPAANLGLDFFVRQVKRIIF